MTTIHDLYTETMRERERVVAHYGGRLDQLWHLIELGLGDTVLPEAEETSFPLDGDIIDADVITDTVSTD